MQGDCSYLADLVYRSPDLCFYAARPRRARANRKCTGSCRTSGRSKPAEPRQAVEREPAGRWPRRIRERDRGVKSDTTCMVGRIHRPLRFEQPVTRKFCGDLSTELCAGKLPIITKLMHPLAQTAWRCCW